MAPSDKSPPRFFEYVTGDTHVMSRNYVEDIEEYIMEDPLPAHEEGNPSIGAHSPDRKPSLPRSLAASASPEAGINVGHFFPVNFDCRLFVACGSL